MKSLPLLRFYACVVSVFLCGQALAEAPVYHDPHEYFFGGLVVRNTEPLPKCVPLVELCRDDAGWVKRSYGENQLHVAGVTRRGMLWPEKLIWSFCWFFIGCIFWQGVSRWLSIKAGGE